MTAGPGALPPAPDASSAGSDPADEPEVGPGAVRVVEARPDAVDAVRLVVDPAAAPQPDVAVRWLDQGRAVIAGPGVPGGRIAAVLANRSRRTATVEPDARGRRGRLERLSSRSSRSAARASATGPDGAGRMPLHGGPLDVRAIIPGRVVDCRVAEGDAVEAGQQLLVIEAMKMQNELRSPRAGIVERIAVGAGQTVDLGALLLVLR